MFHHNVSKIYSFVFKRHQSNYPVLLPKVKARTLHIMQTVDYVSSTVINTMVPGRKLTELKMGDNVLLLEKDRMDEITQHTFEFPRNPGSGMGTSVKIKQIASGDGRERPYTIMGVGVSITKLGLCLGWKGQ